MEWVEWSEYSDRDGSPMVRIAGGHYPQSEALKMAQEIIALIEGKMYRDSIADLETNMTEWLAQIEADEEGSK